VRRFQPPHRRRPRLSLEHLEDRALPSNYTAASVSDLIADINAANQAGGSNTITLTAATTAPYVLTAVDNTTDGANGLPVITKGTLTIVGNGDTIERSTAGGAPDFRLMDVAKSGSLTLENLTLQNGDAFGSGSAAEGGAIYNKGTLVLNGATIAVNAAAATKGDAAGGGIWSNGALTLENGTLVSNNVAQGAFGGGTDKRLYGGNAFGGGLYVAGGTLTLTSTTLSSNIARGGPASSYPRQGIPGTGFGGGLYVGGGTVTLSNDTVTYNSATYGGGLYLAQGKVYLDAFTVNHTSNNSAYSGYPNIYGSYILQ
jgi:hypothetical protein